MNINTVLTGYFCSGFKWLLPVLLALTSFTLSAQFNPELLSKSTVRVLIKSKRGVLGAASGFLWQKNNQIVTSLHVMSADPKSRVIIEFGKVKRKATVAAILPKADLVLLTVKKPVAGWLPLTQFNGVKPKYKSEVSALGFNRGSMGMSTRDLRKGYVNPEMLQVLLPPDALKNLNDSMILDVKLPIYYLDGSLLPGYSGSPVVDSDGMLIGIGDGGLENGASSVSWVIPASNLPALMASKHKTLPSALDALGPTFAGDQIARLAPLFDEKVLFDDKTLSLALTYLAPWNIASIPRLAINMVTGQAFEPLRLALASTTQDDDEDESWMYEDYEPEVKVLNYQQFEFTKVKSRRYQQLVNSSGNPLEMNHVFTLYDKFFHGYHIDYQDFMFDIYEDSAYGLNIAIPQEADLVVADNQYLLVQGEMFCRTCHYEIQYHARQLNKKERQTVHTDPYGFLSAVAMRHWSDLNQEGDFVQYDDFATVDSFGSERYVLRSAYSDFDEPFKRQFELNYFTAATNRGAWFQAQGILSRFDHDFLAALDKYRGTDCRQVASDAARSALCKDIETMLKILISVHLTSFSNRLYTTK